MIMYDEKLIESNTRRAQTISGISYKLTDWYFHVMNHVDYELNHPWVYTAHTGDSLLNATYGLSATHNRCFYHGARNRGKLFL